MRCINIGDILIYFSLITLNKRLPQKHTIDIALVEFKPENNKHHKKIKICEQISVVSKFIYQFLILLINDEVP